MNGQTALIILNKAVLSEPVHKMTDPGPGCADHLRQRILIHSGEYAFGLAFLAEMRKKQESPSQALFAGVEKLVHEVRFIPDVARQQMLDKQFRHILMLVEHARHQQLINLVKAAFGHRNSCCHAQRLPGEASLAEELAGAQYRDDRFFALWGYYRELYLAPPDVE